MKRAANLLSSPDLISFFNMGGRSGQRQKHHRRPGGERARWAQPTNMQPSGQRAQGGREQGPGEEGAGEEGWGALGARETHGQWLQGGPSARRVFSKALSCCIYTQSTGIFSHQGGRSIICPPDWWLRARFWIILMSPGACRACAEPPAPPAPTHFHPAQPLRSGRLQGELLGRKV